MATPTGPGSLVFSGWAGFLNLGGRKCWSQLTTVPRHRVVQSGFNNFIATEAAEFPGGPSRRRDALGASDRDHAVRCEPHARCGVVRMSRITHSHCVPFVPRSCSR